MKHLYKKVMLTALLSTLASSHTGQASGLTIKNDDTTTITVEIEPGEGTLIKNSPRISLELAPGEEKSVTVTPKDLGDKSGHTPTVFSVKGSVNMPSINNRCSGLFTDKDYKIAFVGTKTGGVVCYREERPAGNKK